MFDMGMIKVVYILIKMSDDHCEYNISIALSHYFEYTSIGLLNSVRML